MTIALTLLQLEGSPNNLGFTVNLSFLYSLPPPRHYSHLSSLGIWLSHPFGPAIRSVWGGGTQVAGNAVLELSGCAGKTYTVPVPAPFP